MSKINQRLSRRGFMTRVAAVGAVGSASSLGAIVPISNVLAQGALPYETLEAPMPTRDKSRVEVLEFFWFGCPHCYAFEPAINKWDDHKPDYIDFVREAPPLNPSWETHSRTFYAAEALGITDGMFDQLFDRIHKDRKPMRDPKKVAKWIASMDLGVSDDKFLKAMKSMAVETALKRSIGRARQAGITGVPSIVINGKYRTGNTLAGGHQGVIDVINERTASEHATS